MSLNVTMNTAAMVGEMRNIANKANSNAARTLKRASLRVRDLAKAYAPHETGALEASIDNGMRKENGRNIFLVFSRGENVGGRGRPVGIYAPLMEEGLSPHGSGTYTLRHDGGKGGPVGGKFFERAIEKGTEDITDEMMAAARDALASSTKGRLR